MSTYFLLFLFQLVVPEVLVDSQHMVTKAPFSKLKISYRSELCVGLGDNCHFILAARKALAATIRASLI